jgi:acetoin utilization deacetylase AcuC-like enzyme
MAKVAFSEQYIYQLPEGHRFTIAKYKRIVDKLLEDKIIGPNHVFDPGMIGREVLLAHDIEYYNKVVQLALGADEIRMLGVTLHEVSVNRALNSVAGTLRSAENAANKETIYRDTGFEINTEYQKSKEDGNPIVNRALREGPESKSDDQSKTGPGLKANPASKLGPELTPDVESKENPRSKADPEGSNTRLGITIGGGYHHAFYDHGEGFCIFNDLAITARYLIDKGLAKRILIIDLDVHQGNGTASILNKDENIFTFSMHGSKNYPAKKQTSDYDLDLPDGTGDKDYLYNLEFALDSILKQFTPDHILYQGGVDVLQSDQLGRLGLTMKGCKKRDEIVFNTIRSLDIPSTLTLGGGYSRDINVIIQAHVNTISTGLEILG